MYMYALFLSAALATRHLYQLSVPTDSYLLGTRRVVKSRLPLKTLLLIILGLSNAIICQQIKNFKDSKPLESSKHNQIWTKITTL